MRIAFDQQIFLLQQFGGISRYICSLCSALAQRADADARIFAPLHYNGHLAAMPAVLVTGRRVPRLPKTFRLVRTLSEMLAGRAMSRFRPEIVHETYYSDRAGESGRARVITVYDMISERFPEYFPGNAFTATKRAAVLRADHVFCISESTRRDLIEYFEVDERRASVVHLGYDKLADASCAPGPDASPGNRRPFLLHVGSRGGYKNFAGLLRALASSDRLRNEFDVVSFGGGRFSEEEHRLMHELSLSESRVIQVDGDDALLAGLYRQAAALVYPSLYEGFGIPPLEAMSLDCPVLCSDRSSIPEVVGDAGEYFDPTDVGAIRNALENVLGSPTRRADLIARGRLRCAGFSWAKCARETYDVYRSLL